MKIKSIFMLTATLFLTAGTIFANPTENASSPPPPPPPPSPDLLDVPPPPNDKTLPKDSKQESQKARFRRSTMRDFEKDFMRNLPEVERKKLEKISIDDPDKFKEELMKLIYEERKKEFDEVMKLRKVFLEAVEQQDKDSAKKQLRELLVAQFSKHLAGGERHIKANEERIRVMTEELESFKKRLAERKEKLDETIDKTLDFFTNPENVPEFPQIPEKRNKPFHKDIAPK